MQVGTLVKPKHTSRTLYIGDLLGIIVEVGDVGLLIHWNNQKRSYELKEDLEVLCK